MIPLQQNRILYGPAPQVSKCVAAVVRINPMEAMFTN